MPSPVVAQGKVSQRRLGYVFYDLKECKRYYLETLLKQIFGQEFVTC